MVLWKVDHGLIAALEFAKRCGEHTEFLMMLWPNLRKWSTAFQPVPCHER